MSPTVIVLAGGLSHERDVSLRSGRRVATALRNEGYDVIESDLNSDLLNTIASVDDPVIFPLLHGETGEDGSLREVLGLLGVPFVGAGGASSRVSFDKSIALPILAHQGFTVPAQVALPHEIFRELGARALIEAMAERIGFPMMVKPARSGSALGCSKVNTIDEVPAAMVGAYAYGQVAVIEEYIDGTEVAIAVLDRGDGPEALPAVEIRPDSGVYDYAARYTAGSTRFLVPAELDPDVARAAAEVAVAGHEHFGLVQLSRADMIIRDGVPHLLEINVAPGMTETSLVPLALEAAGLDLGQVCSDLVQHARRHQPGSESTENSDSPESTT
ncbi:D-alanine--D-alanine ligase family protein [Enemella sp. A6]|uniref:D-alanine--D-alanine ligase family protein n=1 Tax=Enemella sp. A6 TaxID=3440152 RepID=UPI003EBC8DFA